MEKPQGFLFTVWQCSILFGHRRQCLFRLRALPQEETVWMKEKITGRRRPAAQGRRHPQIPGVSRQRRRPSGAPGPRNRLRQRRSSAPVRRERQRPNAVSARRTHRKPSAVPDRKKRQRPSAALLRKKEQPPSVLRRTEASGSRLRRQPSLRVRRKPRGKISRGGQPPARSGGRSSKRRLRKRGRHQTGGKSRRSPPGNRRRPGKRLAPSSSRMIFPAKSGLTETASPKRSPPLPFWARQFQPRLSKAPQNAERDWSVRESGQSGTPGSLCPR